MTRVRSARTGDYLEIVDMIQQFALESPCNFHHKTIKNIRSVQNSLSRIQTQGILLVSEYNNYITGALAAQIQPDLLFPDVKILREIFWWVRPQYRLGTSGAKLLKKYSDVGTELLDKGIIQAQDLALLSNSPDLKLSTRGWNLVETHYMREN